MKVLKNTKISFDYADRLDSPIIDSTIKYVDYGLMTADEMNPKYAEDPTWSSKVNNYIEKIKNN